jgi:hypothetical protein
VLTGSGSTGVISAPGGAPRSQKGNVRAPMADVQELRLAWNEQNVRMRDTQGMQLTLSTNLG